MCFSEHSELVSSSGTQSGDRVPGDGDRQGGQALPARRRRLFGVPLYDVRLEAVSWLHYRRRFPFQRDAVTQQVDVAQGTDGRK